MQTKATGTYLISVHPRWASTFFLSHNPKSIELRKGSFGASLKPGDSIVIYATVPVVEIIGTVKVVKRESLPLKQLWNESRQGQLARVSRTQFDDYYRNQESGIGIWVASAQLLQKPIPLYQLRSNWGARWQPPQQIVTLTQEQMAAVGINHQPNRALTCH